MFSPIFQNSIDGLASAVRLRYVVWGKEDPDADTAGYMRAFLSEDPNGSDAVRIQDTIAQVIADIEVATSGGGWLSLVDNP